MDVIAEHRMVATFPDSGPLAVCLRVGRPEPHPNGYACEVQAEGLPGWQGPKKIFGVGSWQALLLGLRYLKIMLDYEVSRGAVFHWEDGEHVLRVEEIFGFYNWEKDRPPSCAPEV